jgi:hypothetical protein
MTALQDELAEQSSRPSDEQQSNIDAHSVKSCMLLARWASSTSCGWPSSPRTTRTCRCPCPAACPIRCCA